MIFSREMECRLQCGACCVAPSISSPIPGMEGGKAAGIPCVQLLPDLTAEMCGVGREDALAYLTALEQATRP